MASLRRLCRSHDRPALHSCRSFARLAIARRPNVVVARRCAAPLPARLRSTRRSGTMRGGQTSVSPCSTPVFPVGRDLESSPRRRRWAPPLPLPRYDRRSAARSNGRGFATTTSSISGVHVPVVRNSPHTPPRAPPVGSSPIDTVARFDSRAELVRTIRRCKPRRSRRPRPGDPRSRPKRPVYSTSAVNVDRGRRQRLTITSPTGARSSPSSG